MTDYSNFSDEELERMNYGLQDEKEKIRNEQLALNRELTIRQERGIKKIRTEVKGHFRTKNPLVAVPVNSGHVDGISLSGIESEEKVDGLGS